MQLCTDQCGNTAERGAVYYRNVKYVCVCVLHKFTSQVMTSSECPPPPPFTLDGVALGTNRLNANMLGGTICKFNYLQLEISNLQSVICCSLFSKRSLRY